MKESTFYLGELHKAQGMDESTLVFVPTKTLNGGQHCMMPYLYQSLQQ